MSDVRLEDLTKSFKGTTAVDHIDLVVEEGEFFSLLGPSGCGKTTTLRMIGGFEEPGRRPRHLARRCGRHGASSQQAQRQLRCSSHYELFPH